MGANGMEAQSVRVLPRLPYPVWEAPTMLRLPSGQTTHRRRAPLQGVRKALLRAVQSDCRYRSQLGDLLLEGMQVPRLGDQEATVGKADREDGSLQGLLVSLGSRPSEGFGWSSLRAHPGSRADAWPLSRTLGACPSSQRRQAGQLRGESPSHDADRTSQTPSAGKVLDRPRLPGLWPDLRGQVFACQPQVLLDGVPAQVLALRDGREAPLETARRLDHAALLPGQDVEGLRRQGGGR